MAISKQRFDQGVQLKSAKQIAVAKANNPGFEKYILVCGGGHCSRGSDIDAVLAAFEKDITEKGLTDTLALKSGCLGVCADFPNVYIETPAGYANYAEIAPSHVSDIVDTHVIGGSIATKYVVKTVD